MELDEFIKRTLEQILRGVEGAQEAAGQMGAGINPRMSSGAAGRFHRDTATQIQDVDFDVALTVSESSESDAGLQVGVPWIGGKVGSGSDHQRSAENRVRFTVPVLLPPQD